MKTRAMARLGIPVFAFAWAALAPVLLAQAGLDSGGGGMTVGDHQNHASVGSPFETVPASAGNYGIFLGLIEVLYPPAAVAPDADADGNGLPDQWELDNFGATGVDPDADADADGTTNEMEFLAMTDPKDGASVFRPAMYGNGDQLVLPVQTQTGRNYRIWGSPDLTAESWTPLDTLAGDGTLVEWTYLLSDPAALPYFLRVEILLP